MTNSCIYKGWVRHERWRPAGNRFTYSIYLMALDLDELPSLFSGRWFWSASRPALARFKEQDHLEIVREELIGLGSSQAAVDSLNLKDLVSYFLNRSGIETQPARIVLLTQLRYLGFAMNPVSFYYCYDENEQLYAIVAEVNNTPWGEQHLYLIDGRGQSENKTIGINRLKKDFHVSPFMPMDMDYNMRFTRPGKQLTVRIENYQDNHREFDVVMKLDRQEISGLSLATALIRYPLISFKVFLAIYWQALVLFLKGVRFFPHPRKKNANKRFSPQQFSNSSESNPNNYSAEHSTSTYSGQVTKSAG